MDESVKKKPFKSTSIDIFNDLKGRKINMVPLIDQSKSFNFEIFPIEKKFKFYNNQSIINCKCFPNSMKRCMKSSDFRLNQSFIQTEQEQLNFKKFYFQKMNDFSFDILVKNNDKNY